MRNDHNMVDVESEVILSKIENDARRFFNLKLEYKKISFFSATWTVNHVIDENSPLFGISEKKLEEIDGEFLVLLKGFDDTFSQNVNSRYSYKYDEVVWGAKFINVYGKSENGRAMVEIV